MSERPLTEYELTSILINPFYAINIAPILAEEHEPLFSKREWIESNAGRIEEIGAEAYLTHLLDVLEGNFPT